MIFLWSEGVSLLCPMLPFRLLLLSPDEEVEATLEAAVAELEEAAAEEGNAAADLALLFFLSTLMLLLW